VSTEGFRLPVSYVRVIADQLRSVGSDVHGWLAESGLSEAQLASPSLTIDYRGFEKLVRGALAVGREPALGLFVGERLVTSSHGILGFAVLSSSTIRQALGLLERYSRLRTSLVAISVEPGAGEVRVRLEETRSLGDIRRPLLEAVALSVKNVLGTISMGACRAVAIAFPFDAPEYSSLAREMFGCEVEYGTSWGGLTLPLEAMDLPLRTADPEAFREAAAICQRELDKLTADESVAGRVRRVLLGKQDGFPSLQVTARLLHMTPRTLHRRLLDEGRSYRVLLEEVRHALAVEHVKSGRFSMQEIAYTLGYSDLANFRRAFKRWESVPPSTFRPRPAPESPAKGSRQRQARRQP